MLPLELLKGFPDFTKDYKRDTGKDAEANVEEYFTYWNFKMNVNHSNFIQDIDGRLRETIRVVREIKETLDKNKGTLKG